MDPLLEPAETGSESTISVERTVMYLLGGLGIVLGFAVLLTTFAQVNRVTLKPSRGLPAASQPREAEIGGRTQNSSQR
jgi:hypothetical protein